MEVLVTKTSLELDKQSSSRDSGVKCLLYEARNSLNGQQPSELKLLEQLRELNPKMALSQIMTARTESTTIVLTKFGKSPQGSFASYQLSMNEDNFKVFCDISSVNRSDSDNHVNDSQLTAFPRFPLMLHIHSFKYQLSGGGREQRHQHNISHAVLFES